MLYDLSPAMVAAIQAAISEFSQAPPPKRADYPDSAEYVAAAIAWRRHSIAMGGLCALFDLHPPTPTWRLNTEEPRSNDWPIAGRLRWYSASVTVSGVLHHLVALPMIGATIYDQLGRDITSDAGDFFGFTGPADPIIIEGETYAVFLSPSCK